MESERKPQAFEQPHRYRCPGCGADLVYEPRAGCLACPYCGREEKIPESAEQVVERSYEDYLKPRQEQITTLADNAVEVSCAGCGATVVFTPPDVAGDCAFCGGKIVAQPKSADALLAPESVLPFRVSQEDATQAIRRWIAGLWFAPNALKKLARQHPIEGIYLPFWTFDSHTSSYYTGKRGEYYYETEWYTVTNAQGRSETRTRQVKKTRWYPASGRVSRWFDDVLVAATVSLPRGRLDALEPWDLSSLKSYDPAFLSGFKAQRYQVNLEPAFEQARSCMAEVIRRDVRDDIGGDEQQIHSVATSYSGVTFKHLLLPVYVGAYAFNQKVFQVMVNARSGEVQGDRPYSVVKIVLVVLLVLAIVATVYYVANQG